MIAASVLSLSLLLAGCGNKSKQTSAGGPDYYRNPLKVESAPTLKPDFPFGKPPVAKVTSGKQELGAVLADWCWPSDAAELLCDNVGWPPKLPEKKVVKVGDLITVLVPGITYQATEGQVVVNPASMYKQETRPRNRIMPADDKPVEEKELKVSEKGVSYTYDTKELKPGDYVIAYRVAWDAPIGGDATYLIPVEVR